MSRFYRLTIETITLTEDGLPGGKPCKVLVGNANKIKRKFSGTTEPSGDGTQYTVLFESEEEWAKGLDIPITIFWMPATVIQSIIALHKAKALSGEAINLVGTDGAPGNFDIQVVPVYPDPVEGGDEFSTGILKQVQINYRTT